MMRRVLVTPSVRRRAAGRERCFRPRGLALVLALGTEPEPSFSGYRGKVAYQRLDLAKARHLQSFCTPGRSRARGPTR
jgi:hypothetical protein